MNEDTSNKNPIIRFWLSLGFPQKQATMQEFVILLVVGLSGYTLAHIFIPSDSFLSLAKQKSDKIRSPILQEISLMKEEVNNQEVNLLSVTSQVKKTGTPDAKIGTPDAKIGTPDAKIGTPDAKTGTPDAKTSNLVVSKSLLMVQTTKKWKEELDKTNISKREDRIIADLSELLKKIEDKNRTQDNLIVVLPEIYKNLIALEISLENSLEQNLFWTGNWKWIEVIFWSLFGTLIYIIQQTSEYYSSPKSTDKANRNRVLIRRKPQYYYFLYQSPFTALVILWILSMANLSIAGIALALSSAPLEVLISLAFILGLYNRVANTQLNLIVASIFGDAWKRTVRKIEIQKGEDEDEDQDNQRHPRKKNLSKRASIEVYCGDCTDFEVLPDVKVKWSIVSTPSAGIIDTSTGTYIAPPSGFYYENGGLKQLKGNEKYRNYTQDIIKAEREDEPDVSALVLVTFVDQEVSTDQQALQSQGDQEVS